MARYTKDELGQLVIDYAYAYGIDPAIAYQQLKRESANFREDVVYGPFVGGAGDRGIAQFIPGTWADWGTGPVENAYDPDLSLIAWGNYMTWLLTKYGYDYTKALQGYNGGSGNVDRGTVSSRAQTYAQEIQAQAQTHPIDYANDNGSSSPQSLPNPNPMQMDSNTGLYLLGGLGLLLALLIFSRN